MGCLFICCIYSVNSSAKKESGGAAEESPILPKMKSKFCVNLINPSFFAPAP